MQDENHEQHESVVQTLARYEQRIAELEADRDVHKRHHDQLSTQVIHLRSTLSEMQEARDTKDKRIAELQARLDAIEMKSAQPWDEEWERGYVSGWNECRKAALEQK